LLQEKKKKSVSHLSVRRYAFSNGLGKNGKDSLLGRKGRGMPLKTSWGNKQSKPKWTLEESKKLYRKSPGSDERKRERRLVKGTIFPQAKNASAKKARCVSSRAPEGKTRGERKENRGLRTTLQGGASPGRHAETTSLLAANRIIGIRREDRLALPVGDYKKVITTTVIREHFCEQVGKKTDAESSLIKGS